ncbi:hypothetical protein GALL_290510 [mine drainage metagenome]|uniref:Peptidase A1 domain-containing protein n=1 Tax=mine drainage metagenome TaxID=410659 RepID=A0A1J5RAB4_9ZZZZ
MPDVLVDTGSSGLLLRRSALQGLKGLEPADSGEYGFRNRYVSAPEYGALTPAWIGFGQLYTQVPIGIGLLGSDGEQPDAGGGANEADGEAGLLKHFNGILGIAPRPTGCSTGADCTCAKATEVAQYYRRVPGSDGPVWQGPQAPPAYELSNPVAALPSGYEDGFVLRIDTPDHAALQAGVESGTLLLGFERWREPLFGQQAPRIPLFSSSWWFAATNGEPGQPPDLLTLPDSGSAAILAPARYKPASADTSAAPARQLPLFFDMPGAESAAPYGPFTVELAEAGSAAIEGRPLHTLATRFHDGDLLMSLGMPFFYGRTIAFRLPEDPRAVSDRAPEPGCLMIAPGPQGA